MNGSCVAPGSKWMDKEMEQEIEKAINLTQRLRAVMLQVVALEKEIEEWEGDYLAENYYLSFETNVPTGKTNGEKIFRMAQLVFPELRKKDF